MGMFQFKPASQFAEQYHIVTFTEFLAILHVEQLHKIVVFNAF
jgi:hypothetical protein